MKELNKAQNSFTFLARRCCHLVCLPGGMPASVLGRERPPGLGMSASTCRAHRSPRRRYLVTPQLVLGTHAGTARRERVDSRRLPRDRGIEGRSRGAGRRRRFSRGSAVSAVRCADRAAAVARAPRRRAAAVRALRVAATRRFATTHAGGVGIAGVGVNEARVAC